MNKQAWITILIPAIITFLIRSTPFIFFKGKELPEMLVYLGNFLPYAMMGLLVVFALKGVNFLESPFGIPEIVASIFVVIIHKWKRNMLFSIAGGTILYMLIIQYLV